MKQYLEGALIALLVSSAPVWANPGLDGQPLPTMLATTGSDFIEVVIPSKRIPVSEVFKPHALTNEQQAAVDRFLRDHRVTGENEKALRNAFPWMLGLGFVHLPLSESLSHYFAVEQIVENSVAKMDKWVTIPECRVSVPRQPLPPLPTPVVVETPKLILTPGTPTPGPCLEQVNVDLVDITTCQQQTVTTTVCQPATTTTCATPLAFPKSGYTPPALPTARQLPGMTITGTIGLMWGLDAPSASSSSSSNSSSSATGGNANATATQSQSQNQGQVQAQSQDQSQVNNPPPPETQPPCDPEGGPGGTPAVP